MFRDEALDRDIDVLMIPGGFGLHLLLDNDEPDELEALLDWVRAMDARVQLMTSVCTGAALLAAAGVLDGKPATSNHQAFAWVTGFGPRVLWDNVSRWVDAGRYVTSAGVSAGTDMAFHLVARLAGRAVAETAAIAAEHDWHRDPSLPIHYPQQATVPSS
jgi:putative intracellular protease/amidase